VRVPYFVIVRANMLHGKAPFAGLYAPSGSWQTLYSVRPQAFVKAETSVPVGFPALVKSDIRHNTSGSVKSIAQLTEMTSLFKSRGSAC
jgi:hypothetical protein